MTRIRLADALSTEHGLPLAGGLEKRHLQIEHQPSTTDVGGIDASDVAFER
jgi:hypothetical protein